MRSHHNLRVLLPTHVADRNVRGVETTQRHIAVPALPMNQTMEPLTMIDPLTRHVAHPENTFLFWRVLQAEGASWGEYPTSRGPPHHVTMKTTDHKHARQSLPACHARMEESGM
jgi:hypothetical protein